MSMVFEYTSSERLKHFLVVIMLGAVGLVLMQAPFWVLIAALAVAMISLLIMLDAFFFAGSVYQNCSEPTAISGVLQLIPWCAYPFIQVDFSDTKLTVLAFISGLLNMAGFYLYFEAMKRDQDAVVISVMWNMMIAIVPLLAWLWLGETLEFVQYCGIALVFIGACMATFHKARLNAGVIPRMGCAILLMSVSTVLLKFVFNGLESIDNSSPFWSGFLPHAAGSATVGLCSLAGLFTVEKKRLHFLHIIKRLWIAFLMIEAVQVSADMLFSLALSLGIASIVAAMDGLMGVFSAGFALGAMWLLAGGRFSEISKTLYQEQMQNFPAKLSGMATIAAGGYLIF